MKLTVIILLVASFQLSARGITQSISISVKDAPLLNVLKAIEKQTDYVFFVNNKYLQKAKKVTINVNNLPVQQVLEICFKEQPLTYTISGKVINVIPKIEKYDRKENQLSERSIQLIEVHGRVIDSKGQPVAGATITVEGTNKTTITDVDGKFKLTGVDEDAIIVITHVQYESENLSLNGNSTVNATLKLKINSLDELQVIAYGTTTKRFSTGNVISVKAKDIEKQPVNNPLLALQGRVAGLFITQANGLPGSGVTVRIQGINSIGRGNDPLYVIDGVPYASQLLSTTLGGPLGRSGGATINGIAPGGGSPLSFINPLDIESIEVLKDADATAIYGSRAANGAILITTKKGKAGRIKVDVNLQHGWQKVARKLDLLNTEQYLQMRYEAFKNDGISIIPSSNYDLKFWDTTRNTDWQKVLIGRTAKYTNLNTSISGGNSGTQYLIGAGFHKETTVLPGDFDDQKGSIHFNLNSTSVDQKFHVQFSANYLIDNNQLPQSDRTLQAMQLAPNAPNLYNPDGTLNWMPNATGASTFSNPLAGLLNTYKNKAYNLISNVILGYKVLQGLEIKSSFGYTNLQVNEIYASPLTSVRPESRPNSSRNATYTYSSNNSWIIEPQVSYKGNIGKGKLEILLGTTIQQNQSDGKYLAGSGYNSDAILEDIHAASTLTVVNSIISKYKYFATFGRINYNLRDKYIVDFTARRDGSSRFGSKNQFHNFGSVGGAWIFSQEKLIRKKLSFISFGKVRINYGTTGSDQIGDYQFLNMYVPTTSIDPYQGVTGLTINGLANPYIQWEETKKLQIGLDLGLLTDRILISGNYVLNRSSNQLLSYALPVITGFGGIFENFPATVENKSIELSLNSENVKTRGFSWSTGINLTIPENKLISFSNLETSTYASTLVIGQPVTIIKAYPDLNVDPTTGKYQVMDSKGNATFTPSFSLDRTVLINTLPKFYGGFENKISYKGIQLDFLFQFVKQIGLNYLFNINPIPGGFNSGFGNQPITVLNRWQKPGDITSIQRYSSNTSLNTQSLAALRSERAYSDASYIRLKNLSISWQLLEKWTKKAHLQNCRIYLQGQNLWTKTNYIGLDPETRSSTTLPPLRVFTFGIQVTL